MLFFLKKRKYNNIDTVIKKKNPKKTTGALVLISTVCQAGQGFGRLSQITALAED